MKYSAPIALFVYNRPEHTGKTLETLMGCQGASESELFIFSDGPKQGSDYAAIAEVRKLCADIKGFKTVTRIYREQNLGLSGSIRAGIDYILERYDRIIVLEDDIVVSDGFLSFLNGALQHYQNEVRVGHIAAHTLDVENVITDDFYFLQSATCWGWATWKRAWGKNLLDVPVKELIERLITNRKMQSFSFNYTAPYVRFLHQLETGNIDSWAIKWYASLVLGDMMSLHPKKPIATSIGLDGTGTHGDRQAAVKVDLWSPPVENLIFPAPEISRAARQHYINFYKQRYNIGKWKYFKTFLKNALHEYSQRNFKIR